MLEGELVVTETDEKWIPKFKNEEDTKSHVEGLIFWEQDLYEKTKDDCKKFSRLIRKDLSLV